MLHFALADLGTSKLVPLGLTPTVNSDGALCAEIDNPVVTMALYPILRLKNWKDTTRTYLPANRPL
jgi:hypothetical protein